VRKHDSDASPLNKIVKTASESDGGKRSKGYAFFFFFLILGWMDEIVPHKKLLFNITFMRYIDRYTVLNTLKLIVPHNRFHQLISQGKNGYICVGNKIWL
jgi:hypothetical protein